MFNQYSFVDKSYVTEINLYSAGISKGENVRETFIISVYTTK